MRCDHCLQPVERPRDDSSDELWDNPRAAHHCERCSSVICTTCALARGIHDPHNPGWTCPECLFDHLYDD